MFLLAVAFPDPLLRARSPLASPSLPVRNPRSGRIPSVASMGNLSEVSAQSADTVDERSADQIVAAKEAVLELPHAPFVAAVLDGSIATTGAVAAGLGDVAEEVRDAALSLARAAVSGDAAAGKSSEILSALAAAVPGPRRCRRRGGAR